MAVSFITRFRRRIAAIPYVILFVVPVLLVVLFVADRREDHARGSGMPAENGCLTTDELRPTDPCSALPTGATD